MEILVRMSKAKLTLSIKREVVLKAKERASMRGTRLSNLVENFLTFYIDPWLYCFHCGVKFYVSEAEVCPKCGWLICPHCRGCGCGLDEKTIVGLYYMRKVYEDLLLGKLK